MIPKEGLDLNYVRAALKRRFWYVVVPFFLLALATIVYCIMAPKIYLSSALILIQPQEVPADYVKATVTSNVEFRLNAITEQVMSRSRLEEIINKYDLYSKIREKESFYIAVEKIRKDITIDIKDNKKSRWDHREPTAFEVSFEGKDPVKTRDITQAIANLFIDYNFKLRSEQAAGTTKFLNRQLARVQEELRQKEELVRKFKEQYIGLLPEQMQNNYNILTQLQQQLDSLNNTVQRTEDRKIMVQNRLSRLKSLEESQSGAEVQGPQSLEQLRSQLQTLRSRYSDQHPDVMKLSGTIAKMEKEQQTNTLPTNSENSKDSLVSARQRHELVSVQHDELFGELRMIDKEINSLRQEIEETNKEVEQYRHRIESGPKIEQMFVDLRRDYERANENYQSLLQKKLEAELAENLERTQKGEQFKILDNAHLPEKPKKPDILRILGIGFMLAIACGLGLAFLREYLDPAFWTKIDVHSVLELPVLVSIPVITTDRENRLNRLKLVGTVCGLAIMSFALLYALFILWQKNPTLVPL